MLAKNDTESYLKGSLQNENVVLADLPSNGSSVELQLKAIQVNLGIDIVTLVPVLASALLSQSVVLFTDIFDIIKGIMAGFISWHILNQIVKGKVEKNYDYGPGKIESFGSILATIIILIGMLLTTIMAVQRFFEPKELVLGFTLFGILIQICGLGLNGWLLHRNSKIAKLSYSPLLEAQCQTNRADILSNIGVLVALLLTIVLKPFSWSVYIDPICAILFIVYAARGFFILLRHSLDDLLDKNLNDNLKEKINKHLDDHSSDYEVLHNVQSRRAGSKSFVDISLGFHPDKTVSEVMSTVEKIQTKIRKDIPGSEVNIVLKTHEKKTHHESGNCKVVPLSPETLDQTVALIRDTFALTADENPEIELKECVYPGTNTEQLKAIGIIDPHYWVAVDEKGSVLGITGFYYKPEDIDEAVWGGWTVYSEKLRTGLSRTRGIMLKRLLSESKETNKKYFRLYTSTRPTESLANRLYERVGLTVYKEEPLPGEDNMILYRQVELTHLSQFI